MRLTICCLNNNWVELLLSEVSIELESIILCIGYKELLYTWLATFSVTNMLTCTSNLSIGYFLSKYKRIRRARKLKWSTWEYENGRRWLRLRKFRFQSHLVKAFLWEINIRWMFSSASNRSLNHWPLPERICQIAWHIFAILCYYFVVIATSYTFIYVYTINIKI